MGRVYMQYYPCTIFCPVPLLARESSIIRHEGSQRSPGVYRLASTPRLPSTTVPGQALRWKQIQPIVIHDPFGISDPEGISYGSRWLSAANTTGARRDIARDRYAVTDPYAIRSGSYLVYWRSAGVRCFASTLRLPSATRSGSGPTKHRWHPLDLLNTDGTNWNTFICLRPPRPFVRPSRKWEGKPDFEKAS